MLQSMLTILSTTPARWLMLAENLPADLLTRRPLPEEWSPVECMVHMLDTERTIFPGRVRAFLAGQDFAAFNPDAQGSPFDPHSSPLALVQEFARLRGDNMSLLRSLTPADLPRTVRHSQLGPVTLDQMLHEWAAHDLDHTMQAERALMQPFIAGSGPWQVYFKSNWMGG